MPILASRGQEIRRLIGELADPATCRGAMRQLKALGARVVPHVDDELGRLDLGTRRALAEALKDVGTADGKALVERLTRLEPKPPTTKPGPSLGNAQPEIGGSRSQ